MRKITSLLMLFCAFVTTAWAQITDLSQLSNEKTYFINSQRCFLMYNSTSNANGLATSNGDGGGTFNASDSNQQFKIVNSDGKYYLFSVGANKYVNKDGSFSATATDALQITDESADSPNYPWKLCIGGNGLNTQIPGQVASGILVNGWTTGDAGNRFYIAESEDMISLTYSCIYNAQEIANVNTFFPIGYGYPAVPSLPYGLVIVNKPEGSPTKNMNNTTITLNVEENLPFVAAEDYESITNWYYLKLHADQLNYLYYDAKLSYIDASKTAVDAENRDAYTWAFIGNPLDGFKVVNKLAGAEMILSSGAEPTTDKEYPVLTNASAVTGNTYWDLTASSYGTNGFFMAYDGTTKRLNKQDNKLCYWLDNADAGSTFMVEERDLTGVKNLQALVDEVKGKYVSGTTVGYLTQTSVDAVNAAIAAAETALGGTMTEAIFEQHQAAIQAAIDALETIQPEADKYYRIVSSCTKDHRAGQLIYVNNTGGMQFAKEQDGLATSIGYVFQFVDAGNNTFYMKSVERGAYLSTNKAHAYGQQQALATTTADAKAVAIANMGRENVVSLTPVGGAMIHAQNTGSSVVAWNETSNTDASAWVIEEIDITSVAHPVTISEEANWASLVLGYNATIPEGVQAYTVNELGTDAAILTEVTGAIPAGEAVLLNGAGTHEFKLAASATAIEGNKLEGTVFNTTIAKAAWILGLNEGVIGLYTVTLDQAEGTAFTNNAFKAYLPKTEAAAALRLEIGTTGIENAIVGENGNAAIFDLSGRRVSKMQKGIYIVNGKKVLVK